MKIFHIYLKPTGYLRVEAYKFEVDYAPQRKVTFFKSETEVDENVLIKFGNVVAILPDLETEADTKFNITLNDERVLTIVADHYKVWSSDMISFRDADDKHISDVYLDLESAVAILPEYNVKATE